MKSSALRLRVVVGILIVASAILLLFTIVRPPSHPDTTTTKALLSALETRTKEYKLLSDKVVYSRYARVYSRKVQFPDGRKFEFDIWGRVWRNNSFSVVTIIPFDAATRTFTLCREYNFAHNRFVYAFPQGQFERSKHRTVQIAATRELEEEAGLACDHWINLLNGDGDIGAPQDKYQRETVHYYLCTAATKVGSGKGVDDEEDIEVIHGVTPTQVRELVASGSFQSNNMAAGLMAIDWLRRHGMLRLSA